MAIDIVARAMAAHADSKAISAYQYAVEGGYTGTEEEFRAEVALMAENAQAVNNAVRFDLAQEKTDEQKTVAQRNIGLKDPSDGFASATSIISDELFGYTQYAHTSNATKRRLNDNGIYSTNASYLVRKFPVTAGQIYKVVSDDKFQFQTDDTIPTSGSTTRVGITYGAGTFLVKVPETATYLMVSTLMSGSTAAVYSTSDLITAEINTAKDSIKSDLTQVKINTIKDCGNLYNTPASGTVAEYFVGKDKTYTTINAALTAWAADEYPAAVVYISNGEYNETVFVEDKTIAFIGESKEGTIIRTTTGDYNDAPFRIHHGNVYVANLTAIADHSDTPSMVLDDDTLYAYAFHIDGGNVGGLVHVKNCKAISYQAPPFGMGTIPGSTIRLEDIEAYCYTPSAATKTANNDCILCHLSSTTTYPVQTGDEALELINVKAYTKETPYVLLLKSSGNTKSMKVKAINTTFVGISSSQLVSGASVGTIDALSIGNNASVLNYSA